MPTDRSGILVAHAGKQHAYRVALALQRLGCLSKFVTSGYYKPDRWPDRLARLIPGSHRTLSRRFQAGLDSDRVVRNPRLELPELLARRWKRPPRVVDELVFKRDAKFDRIVARSWADHSEIFWGFQGSCRESLRAAHECRGTAVLELSTVHVTTAVDILRREAERRPEWASTISNLEFPGWYRERLEREPLEADLCIAASEFTRRSLIDAGVADASIEVLPLGADLERFRRCERSYREPKFRILFVGGVGQRKGVADLLEAVRRLDSDSFELVLAGPVVGDGVPLDEYAGLFQRLGRLDQEEIVAEMHRSHVLVLPSILEGFGLVIPEALATGLPVISTTHSAAPEIIRNGIDGFVLEPGDVDSLASCLEAMHADREGCREMSQQAAERAREFTWDAYQVRLAQLVARRWPQLLAGMPADVRETLAAAGASLREGSSVD